MGRFDPTTQFCLAMIALVVAIGFGSIGIARLWVLPIFGDKPQMWSGLLLVSIGAAGFISFAVLLAPR